MKTILIGSVISSYIVLKTIIDEHFPITYVFSLDEKYSENVSGYYPLHNLASEYDIPFKTFHKIGDSENIQIMREIQPDYIFVIGLSQLVKKELLDCAKKGVIGFHPTPLPRFRGRAAMVWQMLLGVENTKCTLFFIDEGMDSGDIIDQQEYVIEKTDYAKDAERKLCDALAVMIPRVLRKIVDGSITARKQNEKEATYLLIRRPEDGLIDWNEPVEKIQRLIRAVSEPYPGAFSMYDGEHKIVIWKADYMENKKYIGIPGQICEINNDTFDILGIDGIIRVLKYENIDNVRLFVGHKMK